MAGDLKRLQSLLYRLITAPDGVRPGLRREGGATRRRLDAIIRADSRLSAVERLSIYANMYFLRLLDALREDFPATLRVVGEDRFHDLIMRYLAAHPPDRPSILHCGRFMAPFLARDPLAREFPFLPDLARLERALIEVFVAPDARALSASELRAIPPRRWPKIMLRSHRSLRRLRLKWKVSDLARAAAAGRRRPALARGPVTTIVWRKGATVFHRDLDSLEEHAFALFARGASFAALCAEIAGRVPKKDPAAEITRRLHRWVDDGLLAPLDSTLARRE